MVSCRKIVRQRNESSNHGRYCRICCCMPSSSCTVAAIFVHWEFSRTNCHCWMPNAPATSTASAAATAPAVRNLPEAYCVVIRFHGEIFGGRNSNGSSRPDQLPRRQAERGRHRRAPPESPRQIHPPRTPDATSTCNPSGSNRGRSSVRQLLRQLRRAKNANALHRGRARRAAIARA